jgi:hypothetical protein
MAKKTKPLSQQQTEQFLMRTSKEFLQSVDDWRRQQDDLPSRSEALRRLTAMALAAEAKKGKR